MSKPDTSREVEARIRAAQQVVSDLCHGKRRWVMRVPVHDNDPDIVIGSALRDALALLDERDELQRRLEERGGFGVKRIQLPEPDLEIG